MVCPKFSADYYTVPYTHNWELMKSVGSHDSSLLLFMKFMEVIVWYFVSDSHKAVIALIVILPWKWCMWSFLCNLIDMIVDGVVLKAAA
jgi:hypothetical protein